MAIYLDYNASTPIDSSVLEEMIIAYRDFYGNADSRTHSFGQNARKIVEDARKCISEILGVDKTEIIFTSGATESNNLSILGLSQWGKENNRKHIISTTIEHKAVLEPLKYLERQGFDIEYINVDMSGRIKPDKILEKLREDTLLVSMMHVNNETGIIQPVKEIGDYLNNTGTFFHIDAAQSFGKLVNEIKNLKYDMMSVSSHKIYGPQGIGCLVLRKKNFKRPPIHPIMFGGGHEGGIRPGTLPVALIAGFGKAAQIAHNEFEHRHELYSTKRKQIINQLSDVNFVINGDPHYCVPYTINISFPGVDSEALMLTLKDSCAVSNGSACTSHDYKPSHVLMAMGLEESIIESAIRFSWGYSSGIPDLSSLIASIKSMQ